MTGLATQIQRIKDACEALRGTNLVLKFQKPGRRSVYLTLPPELQELRKELDAIHPWCRDHGDDEVTGHVEGGLNIMNEDKEIHMTCQFSYKVFNREGHGRGGGRGGRGRGGRGHGGRGRGAGGDGAESGNGSGSGSGSGGAV